MNEQRAVIDVSRFPTYAFGHRNLMWWGTMGIVVIEGSMFALLIAAYFYLRGRVPQWPPNLAPPDLLWGTLNTAILLGSVWPNVVYARAARDHDLPRVRLWLVISLLFAAAFLVLRWFEFKALHCNWDTNAYGSVVWMLLGFHTTHLLTDVIDSVVLAVLMFTGPVEAKRFVDVADNAVYWYFVVAAWLPVYATLYLAVRVL